MLNDLNLDQNAIHIWTIELSDVSEQDQTFNNLLSRSEIERAGKYRFEKDRQIFIAGRTILRKLLGSYINTDPERIVLEFGPYGKPSLCNDKHLYFNLTNSADLIMIAFTFMAEIGIDVEFEKKGIDLLSIAENVFSEKEISQLKETKNVNPLELFYRYWTRKEAFIKATGFGLSMPLDLKKISVINPKVDMEETHLESTAFGRFEWNILSIETPQNYQAALVTPAHTERVKFFNWPAK